MSNKPRTEEQKLRRKYLNDCQKKGIKPMLIDDWKAKYAKKTAKPAAKPAKKVAKPVDRKGVPVHVVHKGDIVKFEDFSTDRIIDFAIRLLDMAWKDIINDGKRKVCKCGKKCAKKPVKK